MTNPLVHPLSNSVSYTKFSKTHQDFVASITSNEELKDFTQSLKDPRWIEAIKKEVTNLEENGTWF